MRLLTLSCFLVWSCLPPTEPQCNSSGIGESVAPSTPAFVPTGVDHIVTFRSPGSTCGINASDLSVAVDVYSPSGIRIALPRENISLRNGPGNRAEATITIKPLEAGDYTARIVFEPGLGALNHQFLAFREATAPIQELLEPSECNAVYRTPMGSVVCEEKANNLKRTSIRRGSQPALYLPGTQVVVIGNTLWLQSQNALERFVDNGTMFVRTHSRPMQNATIPAGSEHTEQYTIRNDGSGVAKYTALNDGGISVTPSISFSMFSENPSEFLLNHEC